MAENIEVLASKTLPNALKSVQDSKETMDKIVAFCLNQSKADYEQLFKQTQEYTKEAITNIAYHTHTVGTHLTNFLKLQLCELENLELQINTLAQVCIQQNIYMYMYSFVVDFLLMHVAYLCSCVFFFFITAYVYSHTLSLCVCIYISTYVK
jgi:hypothetical protein